MARQAKQWNPLDGIGRRKGPDLKQLAQSRVRWRVGVYVPIGIKETKKKNMDKVGLYCFGRCVQLISNLCE